MMQQYREIKKQYPDSILFFRLGDFYEMFFEDAEVASKLLQITLTARSKGEHKALMCGVPYHAAENYIAKLTRLGKKVAICEQLSDPNLPGIVKRDVVRVVTPGTTLNDNVLDSKSNNFLLAVTYAGSVFSLAYADITTGECMSTKAESEKTFVSEFERIAPSEVIVPVNLFESPLVLVLKARHPGIFFFAVDEEQAGAEELLHSYLSSTQKNDLAHLDKAQPYEINGFMCLDEATLKNLEILANLRENKKEGSLLWVVDQTITPMGGRLMRQFLTHPLTDRQKITERLDAVDEFFRSHKLLEEVGEVLGSILDLERITSRLSLNSGNARDLVGLKNSLLAVPPLQKLLEGCNGGLLMSVRAKIDPLQDITGVLDKAIVAEPPLAITEGGMIQPGYNKELDELRAISKEGKSFIQKLQEEEIARTGINNLKVRYNSVFGYYIEISKMQAQKAPAHYIRKQTLVNAERFITPELKEFEEKVLGAEEKITALEHKLFLEIRAAVVEQVKRIQHTARSIALLDTLAAFAQTALQNSYCKPVITEDGNIVITAGRHAVVEKMSFSGRFIPNDTKLQGSGERLQLITGPNMGGKSTYLRQVALITLLSHIGSFVPAESAKISLTDRIFTRVGASDNLVRGQSTFMVEMQETANILANATNKSLVILDEIGRGTSTYDGMSIAWAIMEHLHDTVSAKTLFATHYHELISLADKLPHAANYSVAVEENEKDGVVFLYKIQSGGVDKSYGIEVAKLAGLPAPVIEKARQILTDLEEGALETAIQKELQDPSKHASVGQTELFERTQRPLENPALDYLKEIDLNTLTPIEALNKLAEMKKKLK